MKFMSAPGFFLSPDFMSNHALVAVFVVAVVAVIALSASRRAGPAALMMGAVAMMMLD